MNFADARSHAERQWTENPCGAVGGAPDTLEYFLGVERERYRQQSWQQSYFGFDRFGGKRVLEIGVGQGTDLVQFAKSGAECHGVDITHAHLELARRNFALRGLHAELRMADATALPYPDGYFDAVYSFGVLHHIPDASAVMREIRRVLKPGGQVMLALYRRWSFFHAYMLMVRGILQGKLFRLGYDGLLATIESGADGKEIKPYVKLYDTNDVKRLLRGLRIDDVSIHHMSLGQYDRAWMRKTFDAIEPILGWYVCSKVTKVH